MSISKFILPVLFLSICMFIPVVSADSHFDVGNLLLKVALSEGKVVSKGITITAQDSGDFVLQVIGVRGVTLKETNFSLLAGRTRTIEVMFNSTGLEPGVYVGSIRVTAGTDISYIPIIFEIDSQDVFFKSTLDIPPQYNVVAPGEKLLAQLKVYDLTSGGTSDGLGTTHIDIEYIIYTLDGTVIVSESEDTIIDRQAQLTKTFPFPDEIKEGDYILAVIIHYRETASVATSLFSIEGSPAGMLFDLDFLGGSVFLVLGAIVIFFLIIIALFIYFVRDRDKMLLELRDYHRDDMAHMQSFLVAQQKLIVQKGKNVAPAVHQEVRHKLAAFKKQQQKQEKDFVALKKEGNTEEMKRKLEQWKKQGYNTLALDYKLKELSSKDMQSLLSYWKRNYTTKGIKTNKNSRAKRRS